MSCDKTLFESESFDLVTCKDTFHHFSKPVKVLQEMYRVIKKGGQIYIADLRRDSQKEIILQVIQEIAERSLDNTKFYIDSVKASYTVSEIEDFLKKANIINYKITKPKMNDKVMKDNKLGKDSWLSTRNYLEDRWTLVIKKPKNS